MVVAALLLAASLWPADARVEIQKIDAHLEMRSVTIVRKCAAWDRPCEFTFEYPHLTARTPAARAINSAIVSSFSVQRELEDCPIRIRGAQTDEMDGVSYRCAKGIQQDSIVSVRCSRGYDNGGRTGGYVYFLLLDAESGRKLQTADLINDMPRFRQLIRDQLLQTYGEQLSGEDPERLVDTLVRDLSQNCGLSDRHLSCTALMGMHSDYDVEFPLDSLCPVLNQGRVGTCAPAH